MSLIQGGSGTRSGRSSLLSAGASKLAKYGASIGGAAAWAVIQAATGMRFDPAPAYLFVVELEGMVVALFSECSGLEVTRDVEEYAEGGNNNFVHKLPGRTQYSNITLKRGFSISRTLWDWFAVGMYDFTVQRVNFSIIQGAPGHNLISGIAGATGLVGAGGSTTSQIAFQAMGRGFGKIKHWNVEDAFPVRWKGPDLNTSSGEVAIEEIEIAHHGLDLSFEVLTPMSPGGSIVKAAISGATALTASPSTSPPEPEWTEEEGGST